MLVRASATREVLIPAPLVAEPSLFPIIFRSRRSEVHAVDYCNGIAVFFFQETDLNICRINILHVHAGLPLPNGLGAPILNRIVEPVTLAPGPEDDAD